MFLFKGRERDSRGSESLRARLCVPWDNLPLRVPILPVGLSAAVWGVGKEPRDRNDTR